MSTTGSRLIPRSTTLRPLKMREAGDTTRCWAKTRALWRLSCRFTAGSRLPARELDGASAPRGPAGRHAAMVSDDTLRRALDRLNYVWKRPRSTWIRTRSARKKRRIRRQIRLCRAQRRVARPDRPVAVPACPLGQRGGHAKVWLSGRNARRVIFGAMNLRTGTRLFVPRRERVATFRRSSGKFGRTTGAGMWPCCSMRIPPTRPRPPCRGRGNDPVVVAETVAEVEPDGYSVGTGRT